MHLKIEIFGIVQGVGFRPFVYNLAKKHNIKGFVLNSGKGVTIYAEGDKERVKKFLEELETLAPPLSKIDKIITKEKEAQNFTKFEIKESKSSKKSTLIPPDSRVCQECLAEIRDKSNRRFGYPLINCTNCGPRYTIIKSLPYDRKNTSMSDFEMCKECKREYQDPTNRRYHAQPIGCFECGPKLTLEIEGLKVKLPQKEIIKSVAKLLKDGKIVAVKGLGGFHLLCDATNSEVVSRLRTRKRRPSKPFAVMVKNLKEVKKLAVISKKDEELLDSIFNPIVLLKSKKSMPLSHLIAPNINILGLILPYTPIHHLLFDELSSPLVLTSANISGEPIIASSEEMKSKLGLVFDAILDFDRKIINGCDDSLAMVVKDEIFYLRVARGLAPISIKFEREFSTPSLAVGANQKSTVSIGFDNKIITSAHIGDLDSIDSVKFFEKNIDILKRFYEFRPQNILCDLHEDYESSKWAKEQNLPLQKLPHHFSHTLAVLAEHNCFDEVLSFVWDGTGLGVDGKIWGGEVLLASVNGFERVGHFREFRLLGGERAIKEPKRVALALLFEVLELDKILKLKNPTISSFKEFEIKALYKTWQKGLNSPPTSSAGRLFDAFGSLAGLLQESSYEGESGLILESNYTKTDKSPQNLLQIRDGVIDWENLLKSSLTLTAEEISTNFIDSLAGVVAEFAQIYNDKKIILAGGVWQNRTLLERVLDIIPRNRVLLPKKLPLNDGSISVGQLFWQINKK